jgi:hypothetical protein
VIPGIHTTLTGNLTRPQDAVLCQYMPMFRAPINNGGDLSDTPAVAVRKFGEKGLFPGTDLSNTPDMAALGPRTADRPDQCFVLTDAFYGRADWNAPTSDANNLFNNNGTGGDYYAFPRNL